MASSKIAKASANTDATTTAASSSRDMNKTTSSPSRSTTGSTSIPHDPTSETASSSSTAMMSEAVMVSCGCRPTLHTSTSTSTSTTKSRRRRGFFKRLKIKLRRSRYLDALEFDPNALYHAHAAVKDDHDHGHDTHKDKESDANNANLYFFDALEDELEDGEFSGLVEGELHFIHNHNHNQQRRKSRSQSLLLSVKESPGMAERLELELTGKRAPLQLLQKEPSERFLAVVTSSTQELLHQLQHPDIVLDGDAYPGTLTPAQLEECTKFIQGLPRLDQCTTKEERDKAMRFLQHIFSFRDVEEPAFTICRWLRATKFDAAAILQRCADNQAMFDRAAQQAFYPSPADAIGAPFPVYLSQYPFLPVGQGKNGVTVNYFLAGKINPEGIMAMTTVERLEGYFWWSFMHKMKDNIRKVQAVDPDFGRCEGINIVDLQGLSRAALSSETMQVIKVASKVSDFFPETLHRMLILNAPSFFVLAWSIIKNFIDPQTARRIQMFSSKEQGTKAMLSLIDIDQIPTDYGGNNISIQEAFLHEANDPLLVRQEIDLLHIKKRGGKASLHKKEWTIWKGEVMELNCFTRCCSGASITIKVNGQHYKTLDPVKGDVVNLSDGKPMGKQYLLASDMEGSHEGTNVSIEVQDLDQADKKHSANSRGYFLVVGDIRMTVPKDV